MRVALFMTKPYILAIGDIVTDAFIKLIESEGKVNTDEQGNPWLSLPLGTKPPYDSVEEVLAVGNSANAAVSFARLGLDAGLMAYMGDDAPGKRMLEYLQTEEVDVSTISVENDQKSNYHYVLRYGAERTILIKYEPYTYVWQEPEREPDWIYLSMLSEKSWDLHEQLLTYLQNHPNTKLVFQPGTFHFQWGAKKLEKFYRHAHVVFMNVEEAMVVTGQETREIEELASGLHDLGVTIAIITDGADGAYASDAKRIIHMPNYPDPADPLDRTGAGDAFASTITAALAQGASLETALKWAAVNSMNVCQHLGAQAGLLRPEQIETFLTNAPQDFEPKTISGEIELDLQAVAKKLVEHPKGIFAADQSGGSVDALFAAYDIPSTEETRRQYQQTFLTTPHIEKYVSGVILFDETARQSDDNGTPFVELLSSRGIIPGIKVDAGLVALPGFNNEKVTAGLDGLADRLKEYRTMGIRFAKWRAALYISENTTPSDAAIAANVHALARYALECQSADIVPIVEPEIVHEGNHSIEACHTVVTKVLDALFDELALLAVDRTALILKTGMILPGSHQPAADPGTVARATIDALVHHVPHDVAGIVFLSGGQSVEQSTINLHAIASEGEQAWPLTFSFARALQLPVLERWHGKQTNIHEAQKTFLTRLEATSAAISAQEQSQDTGTTLL